MGRTFVLIKLSVRQMYLPPQGTTCFRVGVNRQKELSETREWVRLMLPLGKCGGLISKHSLQDQALARGGRGFKGHLWRLREPMLLVLEPVVVQKLHSRKAQREALLREEVVRCSRELTLLISCGVCSRSNRCEANK